MGLGHALHRVRYRESPQRGKMIGDWRSFSVETDIVRAG